MIPTEVCPNQNTLIEYVSGDLSVQLAESVIVHLDTCVTCRETIDQLSNSQDKVGAALRGGRDLPEGEEAELARLIDVTVRGESKGASSKPPRDVSEFFVNLRRSGLLSGDEITSFQESHSDSTMKDCMKALVRSKKLTRYQALMLGEGKWKGLVLGNYIILDQVGRGGMGMVFKARHNKMNREVAIKVLPPSATRSKERLARFKREVEMAARLNHDHIVAAHDADEAAGLHFLVMEYVPGPNFTTLVKEQGPLPIEQAVRSIIQASSGLEHAHEQGLIHRDVKPSNLLLSPKGEVKILDLGLARIDNQVDDGLTQSGMVMGTIDFMAPEQALNSKYADQRSDIYSLGCTLFFLVTGKPMYDGETVMEKLIAHRENGIPTLGDFRDDAPAELDSIISRMTAKQPNDRYTTVAEVRADLESFLVGDLDPIAMLAPPKTPTGIQYVGIDSDDSFLLAGETAFLDETQAFSPQSGDDTVAEGTEAQPLLRPRRNLFGRKTAPIYGLAAGAALILLFGLGVVLASGMLNAVFGGHAGALANGGQGRVALVLPMAGYGFHDYEKLKATITAEGMEALPVAFANTAIADSDGKGKKLTPQLTLAEVRPRDFDAVVFCSGKVDEMADGGAKQQAAKELIDAMAKKERVVSAVGNGVKILAHANVLEGRKYAGCEEYGHGSIKQYTGSIEDGNILTFSYGHDCKTLLATKIKKNALAKK